MGKIGLAFRAFFPILLYREVAEKAELLFRDEALPKSDTPMMKEGPAATPRTAPRPARSEAITLLATLQREARFLDLVQEPLAQYGDAQVGAAARDVLQG